MNFQESLAKASKKLMFEQPFYGLYLMMLNKQKSTRLPTAGVSKNGIGYQLEINEMFWENLIEDWRIGILWHELLHIVFFHPLTFDIYPDHEIRAIATDMEINQYIAPERLPEKKLSKEQFSAKYGPAIKEINRKYEAGEYTREQYQKEMYLIPPRGIYLEDFPELNMEARKGTRYYYDKLLKAKNSGVSPLLDAIVAGMRSDLIMTDQGSLCPDHESWEDFEQLSEAEAKLMKSQTDYQLKEVAEQIEKSRGKIPAELVGYIKMLYQIAPPQFDWRSYFRRFINSSGEVYIKKQRRKPNYRFEGNPGIKVKRKTHVLIGVDTSGSVSDKELHEFFREIHHMYKTGTMITIIQCDAAISNIAVYKGQREVKIHGRGGTSFDPVVDYYNENRDKFNSLVYLTDGEAPAPENPKGKILWVLSSKAKKTDHLPGKVIKLT